MLAKQPPRWVRGKNRDRWVGMVVTGGRFFFSSCLTADRPSLVAIGEELGPHAAVPVDGGAARGVGEADVGLKTCIKPKSRREWGNNIGLVGSTDQQAGYMGTKKRTPNGARGAARG